MRELGRLAAIVMLWLGLSTGCGDPPICQSEVFVAIQTSQIMTDVDTVASGVQADIRVRTSLVDGEIVTLEVFEPNGQPVGTTEAAVDEEGIAVFSAVSVPTPATRLRASVSVACGAGSDDLTVEVLVGAEPVTLAIVDPTVTCGTQISPASDIDAGAEGVQIVARVTSAGGGRTLELTNGSGTSSFDATKDVELTLDPGVNDMVGSGLDSLGNVGTADCSLILTDLSLSFSAPAANGILARKDGTIVGSSITVPLCGSVNRAGATVELTIDGAAPVPATVTGTTWCRTITLAESPPSHTIIASAIAGSSFGSTSLVLRVDVTVPPPVVGFVASALDRQRIQVQWQSPDDGGQPVAAQVLKFSPTVLSDANFEATGTVIATATPGAPGTDELVELFPARTGTDHWFAIATFDAAGNRTVVSLGPVTPNFDRTGAIVAADVSQGLLALGFSIANGKFNDDDFEDVAVSAPTQNTGTLLRTGAVYVYFGGPFGIASTPDLRITSAIAEGRLGTGLTAVRWSSATRDDLVIGAPGIGTGGHIFVVRGGASFGTGTRSATSAELQIAVHPTAPGFFAGSALGSALVSADVDGDGVVDLVASAPNGSGIGGIAILYGDTVTGNVLLSDVDSSGINGAICELFKDPGATSGRRLGFYLHAVGPTEGPTDTTDDLVVVYADDYTTTGDTLFVLRSDGTRPVSAGVSARSFSIGRDVQINYVTNRAITEWGSQVTSIDDQNGDGARDLVVSAFRFNDGQTLIVSGSVTGTSGIAATNGPGVTLTTINGAGVDKFGGVVLQQRGQTPDIDGDGHQDVFIGGVAGGVAKAFVWFGGSIPIGTTTAASAAFTITAPTTFKLTRQMPQGIAGRASWVGDLTGDGLDDICWTSPFDNNGDGSFETLTD